MTAEEKVKERWSDAACYAYGRYGKRRFRISTSHVPRIWLSGYFVTQELAWADAAKKLEEQGNG